VVKLQWLLITPHPNPLPGGARELVECLSPEGRGDLLSASPRKSRELFPPLQKKLYFVALLKGTRRLSGFFSPEGRRVTIDYGTSKSLPLPCGERDGVRGRLKMIDERCHE